MYVTTHLEFSIDYLVVKHSQQQDIIPTASLCPEPGLPIREETCALIDQTLEQNHRHDFVRVVKETQCPVFGTIIGRAFVFIHHYK